MRICTDQHADLSQPNRAYADARVREDTANKPTNASEETVARAAFEPPDEEAVSEDAVCLMLLGMVSSMV